MADPILYYTYAYITLEVLFFVGAAFYCIRLSRITGAFRAWTFLIVAMSLVAVVTAAQYLRIVLFDSQAQVENLINETNSLSFVSNSIYGLAVSGLLFLAMFELFKTFRRLRK